MVVCLNASSFSAPLLWRDLPLLRNDVVASDSIAITYLSHYGLDTLGSLPIMGTFQSDSFICVGQIYRPSGTSRGTVFFVHGLFDHVGTVANGIDACLREHYTVAAMDLPGHGLSSGERGGVGDFGEYTAALGAFIAAGDCIIDTPYIFIGHSTGCAVGYEYAITTTHQPFEQMIFLAPLLRSSYYHVSLAGNALLRRFVTFLPRWFRNASHDNEFLRRFHEDPLQPKTFPIRWAAAYYRWFDRIQSYPQQLLPLTVIQGTGDNVVDWRYNLPWFERNVDGVKIVKIEGARHQLLNESVEYRLPCVNAIGKVLRSVGNRRSDHARPDISADPH